MSESSRGGLGVLVVLALLALGLAWWLARGAPERTRSSARVLDVGPSPPALLELPPLQGTEALPPSEAAATPASLELDASLAMAPSGDDLVFHGLLVDSRGEPLSGHELKLFRTGVGALAPQLEATTESRRDGRFAFTGLEPGGKQLEVVGPGEGDLPLLSADVSSPTGTRIDFRKSEGKIYLSVGKQGLPGATVMTSRHASFWVEGAVEWELSERDAEEGKSLPSGYVRLEPFLQDPRAAVTPRGLEGVDLPEEDRKPALFEPILQLNDAPIHEVHLQSFLVGADAPEDTLLVVRCEGYADATLDVAGVANCAHVGTFHLERVAQLEVEVVEAGTDTGVAESTLEITETGGGLPTRRCRYELKGLDELPRFREGKVTFLSGKVHDCDRRAGRYELRVTAPGFVDWKGSGELVLGEEAQTIEVGLVRSE